MFRDNTVNLLRRVVLTLFIQLKPLSESALVTDRIIAILGMRTRIFCLAPASQCVNSLTGAARARAKLDFLRMTEVDIPKHD